MTILDENRIPTIQAVSNSDGITPLNVCADDTDHSLCVDDNTTGSDLGPANDVRDENRKVAFIAVSAVDGITPVPVYLDSATNKLLINSH